MQTTRHTKEVYRNNLMLWEHILHLGDGHTPTAQSANPESVWLIYSVCLLFLRLWLSSAALYPLMRPSSTKGSHPDGQKPCLKSAKPMEIKDSIQEMWPRAYLLYFPNYFKRESQILLSTSCRRSALNPKLTGVHSTQYWLFTGRVKAWAHQYVHQGWFQ